MSDGPAGIRGRVPASPRWMRFRELNNAGAGYLSQGDSVRALASLEAAYRETVIEGAEADGEAMDARARVLGNLAAMREAGGDLAGALEHTRMAIAAALVAESLIGDEQGTRAVRINLMISRAQTLTLSGRLDEALSDTEDALALIPDTHEEMRGLLEFSAHNTRAGILVNASRFEDAAIAAHRALAIAEVVAPQLAVHPYQTLGAIAERTGDPSAAAGYISLAHALSGVTGDPAALQLSTENLARTAFRSGRYDEAAARFAQGEQLAAAAGLDIRGASCRYGLAAVALHRGNAREALDILGGAVTVFEKAGAQHQLADCHALRGDILAIERRFPQADKEYLRARELCGTGFDHARMDVRRAEIMVEWSTLVVTGIKRGSLLRKALDLAAPAALATDAMRHLFDPGVVRERWTSTVVAPSMALAFGVATDLLDTAAIISLIESASASVSLHSEQGMRTSREAAEATVHALLGPQGFSTAAREPEADTELPAAASAILLGTGVEYARGERFALPPRLDLGLTIATPLDGWIAAAEERYSILVRDRSRVATW